jgi:hypothetical protein
MLFLPIHSSNSIILRPKNSGLVAWSHGVRKAKLAYVFTFIRKNGYFLWTFHFVILDKNLNFKREKVPNS